MNRKRNLAWHFTGPKLRDGSPLPKPGKWLTFSGPLVMCESGLHASRQPSDALRYAPGNTLHLVEVGGKIIEGSDKLVCSRRKIIVSMDAEPLLRYYARMQALSVLHLWDAPNEVLDWLMCGDEETRAAAWAAAGDAAWGAAWAAAGAAAGDAAWAAAGDDFNALVFDAFEDYL